ncbi:MAG TPA: glycosyltransferase [Solirubrobacterales bacterium]
MLLSYCVVNTNGRKDLLACLEAIERTAPTGIEREVLVLDNASEDGSADAVRRIQGGSAKARALPRAATRFTGEEPPALRGEIRLIALERRSGKAGNDSRLLQEATGEFCLLLNEDSELRPGSVEALLGALRADPGAAAAGAQLVSSDGRRVPCAWRLPGFATALAGAVFLHRRLTVESGSRETRAVGWVQSSAMLVRRAAAEQVGWLDPEFFVYSDETDFCKRLGDAGWRILYVPSAEAVHHDQMARDAAGSERRIVEYHRNRDRYLRKHAGSAAAFVQRPLLAWPYLLRALAALVLPGHSPRRYWLHARQALMPGRGDGIREAAEAFNRRIGSIT